MVSNLKKLTHRYIQVNQLTEIIANTVKKLTLSSITRSRPIHYFTDLAIWLVKYGIR
jgi:hypothetical protein